MLSVVGNEMLEIQSLQILELEPVFFIVDLRIETCSTTSNVTEDVDIGSANATVALIARHDLCNQFPLTSTSAIVDLHDSNSLGMMNSARWAPAGHAKIGFHPVLSKPLFSSKRILLSALTLSKLRHVPDHFVSFKL